MKVYHLNILATEEDCKELNRVGWDGHPRFTLHADATSGNQKAAMAAYTEGFYKHVATLDGTLDDAFRLTNHITESWTSNEGVDVMPGGHRSTSVGDIIEQEGAFFFVDRFGFEKLEALSA